MKFKIKDENGKEFEVEEIKEQDEGPAPEAEKPAEEHKPEDVHDEGEALSKDEISALKELAAMAPELKKLLEVERKEHAGDEEPEAEAHDEEPAGKDKPDEEVVDTCHDSQPGKGSKVSKAAGSLEKPQVQDAQPSSIDNDLEVEAAWAKRYSTKKEDE